MLELFANGTADSHANTSGVFSMFDNRTRAKGYNEWRMRLAKDLQSRIANPKSLAIEAAKARAPEGIMNHLKNGHLRKFNYNIANTLKYLTSDPPTLHGSLCLDEPLYVLNGLVRELQRKEVWEWSETRSSEFLVRLTIRVLEKMVSHESPLTPSQTSLYLEKTCIEVLKAVSRLNTCHLPATMVAMFPLYNDASRLLEPLISWSFRRGKYEVLEELGSSLSTPDVMDQLTGDTFVNLLKNHWELYKDANLTRQLYAFLGDSGVLELESILGDWKDRLNAFMADIASQPQNIGRVKADNKRDYEPAMSEILKRGERLVRDIYSDLSRSIGDDLAQVEQIASLKRTPHAPGTNQASSGRRDALILEKDFQTVLWKITNVYMCKYSKSDLESVISHFVQSYGMELNHWWVLSVVRHHSRHLDLDSMVAWLQFCFRSGLAGDNVFAQKLLWILSRFWNFPDGEIVKIHDYLQQHVTNLQWPYWIERGEKFDPNSNGASDRDYHQWNQMYIAFSKKLKRPSDGSDVVSFDTMYQAAQREAWGDVWAAHEMACDQGLAFSERCTRLAIYARLKLDDGSTRLASRLVWELRGQGHNMNEVIAPLFLAYLEEATDPEVVIFKAISEGFRVPDNVFKTAAHKAANQQNHASAVKIVQAAIGMNYAGDTLANYQYFALLISSYTAQGDYGRLTTLLDKLTSRKYWWAGNPTITNRLKRAIRTLVRRSCNASLVQKRNVDIYRALIETLDCALEHCFSCKIFVTEREAVANRIITSFQDPSAQGEDEAERGEEGKDDDDEAGTVQTETVFTQSPAVPQTTVVDVAVPGSANSNNPFMPRPLTEEMDDGSSFITVKKTKQNQAARRANSLQHRGKNKPQRPQPANSIPVFPQLKSVDPGLMQKWISDWVESQGESSALQPESCPITSQILNGARQVVREVSIAPQQ